MLHRKGIVLHPHCILHTSQCTMHTVHCILHTTLCTLHCTRKRERKREMLNSNDTASGAVLFVSLNLFPDFSE